MRSENYENSKSSKKTRSEFSNKHEDKSRLYGTCHQKGHNARTCSNQK
ncbi:11634_t:CDS:2 [Dentiscutata heterogama]|uniref:11634_t:CDS:1 n=1 Tax=Dentiscutata heterogama TaxID=1316150 RepID=A0ACA9JWG2_9GLOM|nr:11634_t:CDS:2 [Dentiscutata heterogama]